MKESHKYEIKKKCNCAPKKSLIMLKMINYEIKGQIMRMKIMSMTLQVIIIKEKVKSLS